MYVCVWCVRVSVCVCMHVCLCWWYIGLEGNRSLVYVCVFVCVVCAACMYVCMYVCIRPVARKSGGEIDK